VQYLGIFKKAELTGYFQIPKSKTFGFAVDDEMVQDIWKRRRICWYM
jgi:hypothetical protein